MEQHCPEKRKINAVSASAIGYRVMKASIDRIDGDIAVLVLCDDRGSVVRLPVFLIPGAMEGDLVDLLITIDKAGTVAAREKSGEMVLKLGKKNIH
jgi:hypothetical protein